MDPGSIATALVLGAIVELRVKVGKLEKSLDKRLNDHVSRMHRIKMPSNIGAGVIAGIGYLAVSTLCR